MTGEITPVPMLLFCPRCGLQHVDEPIGEWEGEAWNNPPHRSHLCLHCGCIWRPADVPTVGVKSIDTQGKADNWIVGPVSVLARDSCSAQERTATALDSLTLHDLLERPGYVFLLAQHASALLRCNYERASKLKPLDALSGETNG